jgi:hypothetical protein
MARLLILLLAALSLLAGCKKDEQKKGAWNDTCAINDDCETGLLCSKGICTKTCTSDAECISAFSNNSAGCKTGYCFIVCLSDNGCPSDLTCGSLLGTSDRICYITK